MTEKRFKKVLKAFNESIARGYPPLNPDPYELDLVMVFNGVEGGYFTLRRKASYL